MTSKRKRKVQWVKGTPENEWVTCLECTFQYYVESWELSPCCPICESHAFEISDEYMEEY